jgi:hypothetical protein
VCYHLIGPAEKEQLAKKAKFRGSKMLENWARGACRNQREEVCSDWSRDMQTGKANVNEPPTDSMKYPGING